MPTLIAHTPTFTFDQRQALPAIYEFCNLIIGLSEQAYYIGPTIIDSNTAQMSSCCLSHIDLKL